MANKGLFLRVPSETEGKKKVGQKQKTPFHFFMMEKKQQWERESKWDNSRTKEQLVKVGLAGLNLDSGFTGVPLENFSSIRTGALFKFHWSSTAHSLSRRS